MAIKQSVSARKIALSAAIVCDGDDKVYSYLVTAITVEKLVLAVSRYPKL